MDILLNIIGDYYGLDWVALAFGLAGSWCFTNRVMIPGFALVIVSCICGFIVSILAHQMGFVVYNALLVLINARGIIRGDRRQNREVVRDEAKLSDDAVSVPVQ